jgi:hypothetical protein
LLARIDLWLYKEGEEGEMWKRYRRARISMENHVNFKMANTGETQKQKL